MRNYYCTYQCYYNNPRYISNIYGIGTTRKASQEDALKYLDEDTDMKTIFTTRCTKRCYDYVASQGGDGDFVMNPNLEVDLDIDTMNGYYNSVRKMI